MAGALALIASLHLGCGSAQPLRAAGDQRVGKLSTGRLKHELVIDGPRFLRLAVEQRGIDVRVSLRSSQGETLINRNGVRGRWGTESITAELKEAGTYSVGIEAITAQNAPGSYRLVVEILRSPGAEDRRIIEAERVYLQAIAAVRDGLREGLVQTVELHGRAIAMWESQADLGWMARALAARGRAQINLGDTRAAKDDFDRALALAREADLRHTEAAAQLGAAVVAQILGDRALAEERFEHALELYRTVEDLAGEADTLDTLASFYNTFGQPSRARELQEQSLGLWRSLGSARKEGKGLTMLGLLAEERGEREAALALHRRALELRRRAEDWTGVAVVLSNLGKVHFSMGEYQDAIAYWNQALVGMEETGRVEYSGTILGNLGAVYRRLGDHERALETYRRALAIGEGVQSARARIRLHNNMGTAFLGMEDFEEAESYLRQAAAEAETTEIGDLRAAALKNLGDLVLRRTARDSEVEQKRAARDARSLFSEAQSFFEGKKVLHDVCGCLIGRAQCAMRLGNDQEAEPLLLEAISLARRIRDRGREELALTYLARLMVRQGAHDRALGYLREAMSIVERQRSALASHDLRSSFFARRQRLYAESAQLLVAKHLAEPSAEHLDAALLMAERAKARSLVEFLQVARVEVTRGVSKKRLIALRDADRALAVAERQWRANDRKGDRAGREEMARQIGDQERHRETILAGLAEESPYHGALTQGLALDVEAIRARAMPPNALLLEVLLGEDESLLFALTHDDLQVFELPARSVIEAEAERFAQAVVANRSTDMGVAERSAARLGRWLIRPIVDMVDRDVSVILAVGDGILHALPFGALPWSDAGTFDETLLDQAPVIQLPSASVAALLSHSPQPSTLESALIVADPRYSPNDPRGESADRLRGGEAATFPPLPFSRREAAVIASLMPGESLVLVDLEASLDAFSNLTLSAFDLLHFGAHTTYETSRPGASGLMLSMFDHAGKHHDGLLSIREVYNLELDAALVVLSACRTAQGDLVQGEGLVGLVNAFLYAGARNVVATLWPVDDRATAQLMAEFYHQLLVERQPPAFALRLAQQSLREQPAFRSPYFWAPFILVGTAQ